MTADDIQAFCDNLKASMLKAHAAGTPVHVGRQEDTDRLDHTDAYETVPFDYLWQGCTIRIGRPAREQQAREHVAEVRRLWRFKPAFTEAPESQPSDAITVWRDGTWKRWSAGAAKMAENDDGWLATVPVEESLALRGERNMVRVLDVERRHWQEAYQEAYQRLKQEAVPVEGRRWPWSLLEGLISKPGAQVGGVRRTPVFGDDGKTLKYTHVEIEVMVPGGRPEPTVDRCAETTAKALAALDYNPKTGDIVSKGCGPGGDPSTPIAAPPEPVPGMTADGKVAVYPLSEASTLPPDAYVMLTSDIAVQQGGSRNALRRNPDGMTWARIDFADAMAVVTRTRPVHRCLACDLHAIGLTAVTDCPDLAQPCSRCGGKLERIKAVAGAQLALLRQLAAIPDSAGLSGMVMKDPALTECLADGTVELVRGQYAVAITSKGRQYLAAADQPGAHWDRLHAARKADPEQIIVWNKGASSPGDPPALVRLPSIAGDYKIVNAAQVPATVVSSNGTPLGSVEPGSCETFAVDQRGEVPFGEYAIAEFMALSGMSREDAIANLRALGPALAAACGQQADPPADWSGTNAPSPADCVRQLGEQARADTGIEPPCLCPSPSVHDAGCAWVAWRRGNGE